MVNMCCAPGCKQGYKSTPKDPSVTFHTFPKKDSILSEQLPRPTQAATTSKRSVLINERQEALRKELSMKESVKTAQELYHKLTSETLPSGFTLLQLPKVSLVKMVSTENGMDISLSLEVDEDLSFQMYHRHSLLEKSLVSHCMTSIKKIRSITEALNIAAYLGSRDQLPDKEMFEDIRARLERYIHSAELEEWKKIFSWTPFFLFDIPEINCMLCYCGSRTIIIDNPIPPITNPRPLHKRKNVTLIIDEVYSAQRIEFATKTVLTFMIKSAGGKYMDVVALVPVVKLTAELLFNQYTRIMKTLWEIDFTVVSLSVDNHTVNRRFYTQFLCEDNLQTWIPHPHDSSKRVHLLIDSVHNFKNIYNCFQRKDYLELNDEIHDQSRKRAANKLNLKERKIAKLLSKA
ncbi:Putative LOC101234561 [Caligus rogercresseyi]|uniref:LOC101234561 n=1 Tax=Caligus rogercresseyi TaxID=217165 RepID=A0A7T8HKN6_CALRO|nr:Putative LOC101234561 [Caligus rogercresseyi]